eukprot:5071780-Prymnesium_polylepis.1
MLGFSARVWLPRPSHERADVASRAELNADRLWDEGITRDKKAGAPADFCDDRLERLAHHCWRWRWRLWYVRLR